MKTWENFLILACSLYTTNRKKILEKFYFLPYLHKTFTKTNVQSVVVTNGTSVEIILYLMFTLCCYVVYIICWRDQLVGSATDFKTRNCSRTSYIKSKRDICGTARFFKNKLTNSNNFHLFRQIQLIKSE